jgi:hypothetical protein
MSTPQPQIPPLHLVQLAFHSSAMQAMPTSPRMYRHAFTAQLTVDIPGSMHGLGTEQLLAQVFLDNPPHAGGCLHELHVDPQTGDVCIKFCHTVTRALEPPVTIPIPGRWLLRGLRTLRRWHWTRWLPRLLLGELEIHASVVWEPPQTGTVVLHGSSRSRAPLSP